MARRSPQEGSSHCALEAREAVANPDYSRGPRASPSVSVSCRARTRDIDARINSHRAPLIVAPAYSPSCAKDVAAPTAFAHLLFAPPEGVAKSIPRSPSESEATRDPPSHHRTGSEWRPARASLRGPIPLVPGRSNPIEPLPSLRPLAPRPLRHCEAQRRW